MTTEVRRYIKFVPFQISPSRRLQIWQVVNKRYGDLLGVIAWNNAWKCYCFEDVNPDAVFSSDCLGDIASFCVRLTAEAE